MEIAADALDVRIRKAFGIDRAANPWSDIPLAKCLIIAGANALVFETGYGRRAAALPVGEDTPVPLKIIAGFKHLSVRKKRRA